MFGIGATELVLILVLALIFIGPEKLPEVARTFGRTYRELQNALESIKRDFVEAGDSIRHEIESSAKEAPPPDAPAGSVETKLTPPDAPAGSVETKLTPPDAPAGSVETKPATRPDGSDPS